MKILVTGFTPYKPFETNASERLIRSFQAELPDDLGPYKNDLVFEIVSFEDTDAATQSRTMTDSLFAMLEKHKPDVCIFCGQAPNSCKIQVEKIALAIFRETEITSEDPLAYASDLPGMDKLPDLMSRQEIPFAFSYHAGTYLCNHILYSTLHHASINALNLKAGFVHIPLDEQQATTSTKIQPHANVPFMPLSMTRRALTEIILNTIKAQKELPARP